MAATITSPPPADVIDELSLVHAALGHVILRSRRGIFPSVPGTSAASTVCRPRGARRLPGH